MAYPCASNKQQHSPTTSQQQFNTPGLQLLATVIEHEHTFLQAYASKVNPNIEHLNRRNAFLESLTDSYNIIYQELIPLSELSFLDKWVLAEHHIKSLMKDTTIGGIHIKLQFTESNNYGFITL